MALSLKYKKCSSTEQIGGGVRGGEENVSLLQKLIVGRNHTGMFQVTNIFLWKSSKGLWDIQG